MFSGTRSLGEVCQPALSSTSTAWEPSATRRPISARCAFMASMLCVRQHDGRAHAALRADGAEQPGPGVAAVAQGARARAPLGPNARQRALLADPGPVLLRRLGERGG